MCYLRKQETCHTVLLRFLTSKVNRKLYSFTRFPGAPDTDFSCSAKTHALRQQGNVSYVFNQENRFHDKGDSNATQC